MSVGMKLALYREKSPQGTVGMLQGPQASSPSPCWEHWLLSRWCGSFPLGSLAGPASPSRPRSQGLGRSPVETGSLLNSQGWHAPPRHSRDRGMAQEPTGRRWKLRHCHWQLDLGPPQQRRSLPFGLPPNVCFLAKKNMVNQEEWWTKQTWNVLVLLGWVNHEPSQPLTHPKGWLGVCVKSVKCE